MKRIALVILALLPIACSGPYGQGASSTPAPTGTALFRSTRNPHEPLRTPEAGSDPSAWGWNGSIQVWGSNTELLECPDGRIDMICVDSGGKRTNFYNFSDEWTYLGEVRDGTSQLAFDEPVLNIALTWKDTWYIDSIVGLEPNGNKVWCGYAPDGEPTQPYQEFINYFTNNTIGASERQMERFADSQIPQITCGIVGNSVDGSYSRTGPSGAMVFRLLAIPYAELLNYSGYGNHAVAIQGIVITAYSVDRGFSVCP